MENTKKKRKDFKKKLLELLESSSEDETENPPPVKRRRRIILDDSDEENSPPSPPQSLITPNLLEKIGFVSKQENNFTLHKDVKSIWDDVLKRGLNKDTVDSLLKKIPEIKDCYTSAPMLNQEIKVTLSPQAVKRDEHLCEKQNIIGAAICGLSELLQDLLDGKDTTTRDNNIEKLSNYVRLLCHVHHMESQTRRAVILPGLNKNLKESLEKTDINQNLFGKNLSEIIRDARSLEKSKKDLARPLNNWGPSGVRKQGGQTNYKRPYQYPPAKQPTFQRARQQRQQFRAMIKPKDKEVPRRAPVDNRRRRD